MKIKKTLMSILTCVVMVAGTVTSVFADTVGSLLVADFLNSAYNIGSACTVYDGTNSENAFQMMGKTFSQGIIFNKRYNSTVSADISFNVENINNIIFTLGHLDNAYTSDGYLKIYIDDELTHTLPCYSSMNVKFYKFDTSDASQLCFQFTGDDYYWDAYSYGIANIVLNEDFSAVPEGSYDETKINNLDIFYEPTETTAPMQIPTDGKVYNGHTYKAIVNSSITTWKDAQAYCQSLGGHLATISDSGENDFVYELIKKETDVSRFRLGGYYTSLTDSWAWVDGTEFSYTNWSTDQPDNYENKQFCLTMPNQDIYDGKNLLAGMWDDDYNYNYYNADVSYGIVCEWDDELGYIQGDANLDGTVNVRDCAYIASKLSKGKGSDISLAGDYNGDGTVNVRDAAAIAYMLCKA